MSKLLIDDCRSGEVASLRQFIFKIENHQFFINLETSIGLIFAAKCTKFTIEVPTSGDP